MAAALEAHLTPKQLRETGLVRASVEELEAVLAKDMQRQVDTTWEKGVLHGEWLKEGKCQQLTSASADVALLRQQNLHLTIAQIELRKQLTFALDRVQQLTAPPPACPPPSPDQEITLEELAASLSVGDATHGDDELSRVLEDLTNLL
jgi:hypothetical protein